MTTHLSRLKLIGGWPWLLLLAANSLILFEAALGFRYLATLSLLAFLPGWSWLPWFSPQRLNLPERLLLAIGLSLALTILTGLGAVYLPGALSLPQILIIINTIIVLGLALGRIGPEVACDRLRLSVNSPPEPVEADPSSQGPAGSGWAIILALLLLAAGLRLPGLGYAEFHEDEAEALMLGVRLLQGEDYALFLHRKGPAQMLLPLAFWLLAGQTNEALARFPFALSSLLSMATLALLGRRCFKSDTVGLLAGLLWAVNGYSLAFGRMVQYQALIFFLGPLALYSLYLAWQFSQPAWQFLASLLLATCLLAHFDALLLLPAAAYLSLTPLWPNGNSQGLKLNGLLPWSLATLLFLSLLAAFYIPYTRDPDFQNTLTYLAESRVKPGLLYNNLGLLQRLDQDYSSRFYLPGLGLGLLAYLFGRGRYLAPGRRGLLLALALLAASTLWWPALWRSEPLNLAVGPWLLFGLAGFWFWPARELRAVWLLAGIPALGYLFFVDDPRTHLYMLYPGLILLAAAGWRDLGQWSQPALRRFFGRPGWGYGAAGLVVLLWLGLIILYQATIFLSSETGLDRRWAGWAGSAWATLYDELPEARSYVGYPKREGWKTIGALRSQGQFPGDFRSVNEDFIVPIWYNYGQARSCYETPAHFFVRLSPDLALTLPAGYHLAGEVRREGETRLQILSAGPNPGLAPLQYELARFEAQFDALATPAHFARQAEPSRPAAVQFGPAIRFTGYDLPESSLAPGQTLHLNLYWQALGRPGEAYRVFVHLTDGATLWAQQDDELACRLPTSIWRAGQAGLGQFRLSLNPATPPGRYPLIIGVYQATSLERLPITAGGTIGDDFLWLGDIEVK